MYVKTLFYFPNSEILFPCQTRLEFFVSNFGFPLTHLPCSLKEELVICQLILSDSQSSKQTSNCDRCSACL